LHDRPQTIYHWLLLFNIRNYTKYFSILFETNFNSRLFNEFRAKLKNDSFLKMSFIKEAVFILRSFLTNLHLRCQISPNRSLFKTWKRNTIYFFYLLFLSLFRQKFLTIIVHNFVCAVMLILASQRIENVIDSWMGHDVVESEPTRTKRGAPPTVVEW